MEKRYIGFEAKPNRYSIECDLFFNYKKIQ